MDRRFTVKEIAYGGIFVALTIVGAQISIPIGQVPITFQTLFVVLSSFILNAKLSFITQLTYIALGAIGLPVFAGFSGGIAQLYGPLGGYLISFPIATYIGGLIADRDSSVCSLVIASLTEIGIIYLFGWLRLGIFIKSFKKAVFIGILPFIPWDLLKALGAIYAYKTLKRRFIAFSQYRSL